MPSRSIKSTMEAQPSGYTLIGYKFKTASQIKNNPGFYVRNNDAGAHRRRFRLGDRKRPKISVRRIQPDYEKGVYLPIPDWQIEKVKEGFKKTLVLDNDTELTDYPIKKVEWKKEQGIVEVQLGDMDKYYPSDPQYINNPNPTKSIDSEDILKGIKRYVIFHNKWNIAKFDPYDYDELLQWVLFAKFPVWNILEGQPEMDE